MDAFHMNEKINPPTGGVAIKHFELHELRRSRSNNELRCSSKARFRRYISILLLVVFLYGILWRSLTKGVEGAARASSLSAQNALRQKHYPSPRGGTVASWADSYQKAQKMVERMSLVEKVNITTGVGWQMGLCVGNTGPASSVGFPSLCLQDGPLGLRFADNVTAFPAGLTAGATWNKELIRKRGQALGREARIKGVNVLLAPSMGPIGILPAGGRNWEGFGSDPVLQAIAAAETVLGIQENGVIATAKHFVLNEQEHFRKPFEWGLPGEGTLSAEVDDRSLREVYAWPFAETIRAGVGSVMCSYQLTNMSFSCSNSKLLNGILKDEFGFQGFVQSDWIAARDGVDAAMAGLDVTMPGDGERKADGKPYWGENLTRSVLNSSVSLERLNDMVTRVVAAWYQMKQDSWPKPPPDGDGGPNFSSWTNERLGDLQHGSNDTDIGVVNRFINAQGEGKDSHGILARQIAAEGIVLVKNVDNVLPLSRNPPSMNRKLRVGVFGEDAGPGLGANYCADRGCNQGTLASGWGSGTTDFPYLITPWEALKDAFNTQLVEISGHLTNSVQSSDIRENDLCLVFANADGGEGYISSDGIHGDRNDVFLQKGTDKLVTDVARSCGNGEGDTVVIIHAVGPVVLEPWVELPGIKAVVLAHLPGQESGDALVDVLFGGVDASGRLPYTIGKDLNDYGPDAKVLYDAEEKFPKKNFSHGLYIDYRYFDKHDIAPRYEFGYGLSYTTFELSNLAITPLQSKSELPSPRPEPGSSPPTYSGKLPDPKSVLFPPGFGRYSNYIYPYLSSLDGIVNKTIKPADYRDNHKPSQAGGGEGGNPSLFEPFVNVSVTLMNTGSRAGKEVIQLYVSFPDEVIDRSVGDVDGHGKATSGKFAVMDFPVRVLRNFHKAEVQPGRSVNVSMTLTRKDLSYWSTLRQNWVMPVEGEFKIWVGRSSRDLPLVGTF